MSKTRTQVLIKHTKSREHTCDVILVLACSAVHFTDLSTNLFCSTNNRLKFCKKIIKLHA